MVFTLFKLILSMLGLMTIHLFLPRHQHPCGHAGQVAGPTPEHKGDIFLNFLQINIFSPWIIEFLFVILAVPYPEGLLGQRI